MNITDDQLHDIAEVAYAATVALVCQHDRQIRPSWLGASVAYKAKFTAAVKIIVDNINKSPSELHDRWVVKMKAKGWKYADFTDKRFMLSPQITAYENLDFRLRQRDALLHNIVRALLETK